jgi:hypothetical protein
MKMSQRICVVVLSAASLVCSFAPLAGAVSRNPIARLPHSIKVVFECILWHESRSTLAHLNLKDNNPYGSSGILQIEPVLWNRWAPLAGVHVPVWRATPVQQEEVGIVIHRYDGWVPWSDDGCV